MIIEVTVPAAGESVTEATLAKWFVEVGDYVNMDDPICELETDKASMELPAEKGGEIIELLVEEEEDVQVGAVIAKIDTSVEKPAEAEKKEEPKPEKEEPKAEKKEEPKQEAPSEKGHAAGHPSPAAAKILAEKNVSPSQIQGTGKDGRITKQDALMADISNMGISAPKASFSREERTEKMSRLRRTIAKHLVHAKNDTAMLTTFNELNMQPLMDIRNKYKTKFEKRHDGTRLGFMGFFTKAVCHALEQVPAVNGIIEEDHIKFHDYCDISIAVSTPKGLVTPVVRNAESLTVAETENEIRRLALLGRDGKLGLDDLQGGTFTITNGGVFGSMMSTPIINAPQSAILGMHNIVERPVAENGQVVIRPMMYLALSYDHRIIDGKESVTFLVKVKEMLENPERLLLGKDPVESMLFL